VVPEEGVAHLVVVKLVECRSQGGLPGADAGGCAHKVAMGSDGNYLGIPQAAQIILGAPENPQKETEQMSAELWLIVRETE